MKRGKQILGLIFAIGIVMVVGYLFLTNTSKNQKDNGNFLLEAPIAHRGLHDDQHPENSLGAFQQAIAQQMVIELDVQFSKDKTLMVFHDNELSRMTGQAGNIGDYTKVELQQLRLAQTAETIPTLEEVLAYIDGKTGILIEIKDTPDLDELCQAVAKALEQYEGDMAVQSFNPFAIEWFKDNAPDRVRGILAGTFKEDADNLVMYEKFALKNLLLNFKAKPQFIAYQAEGLPNFTVQRLKAQGIPILVWTIRSQEQYEHAQQYGDNIIFDQYGQ